MVKEFWIGFDLGKFCFFSYSLLTSIKSKQKQNAYLLSLLLQEKDILTVRNETYSPIKTNQQIYSELYYQKKKKYSKQKAVFLHKSMTQKGILGNKTY